MSNFDRIASSAPLDKTAAMVTGRGEEWRPAVEIKDYFADMPPLAAPASTTGSAEYRDFTGAKFGRLTVIGKLAKENDKAATSWVCRCVCGGFCTRRTRSLKVAEAGGDSFVDRCGKCAYEQSLRSGWTPRIKQRATFKAGSRVKIPPARRAFD